MIDQDILVILLVTVILHDVLHTFLNQPKSKWIGQS